MKTTAKVIIFLVFFLSSSYCFSQDTASARFFPLKIGNSWTYHYKNQFWQTYDFKITISEETIIDGKRYFGYNNSPYFISGWIRYDSLTSNLIIYRNGQSCSNYNNHAIIDTLGALVNQGITCTFQGYDSRYCTLSGLQTIYSMHKEYKQFYHVSSFLTEEIRYVKDIGIINICWGEPTCVAAIELQGCVINGIVYGDTSLSSIEPISNIIPDKFELKQNYPNPFNPATNIKFSLPKSGFVNLKVYDINGKEITTLVNENLQAGEYQTSFNASDLSSGIYFYTIKAGEFIETRRMVLVK